MSLFYLNILLLVHATVTQSYTRNSCVFISLYLSFETAGLRSCAWLLKLHCTYCTTYGYMSLAEIWLAVLSWVIESFAPSSPTFGKVIFIPVRCERCLDKRCGRLFLALSDVIYIYDIAHHVFNQVVEKEYFLPHRRLVEWVPMHYRYGSYGRIPDTLNLDLPTLLFRSEDMFCLLRYWENRQRFKHLRKASIA